MATNIVEYALKVKDSNAKKALKDTAKGADAAAKATKNFGKTTDVALKNINVTAGKTRKEWMALRKDSANLDRLTGELASAFGLLHPEMGKAVSAASAVAGGAEGVIRAFTLVNMKLVAVIAAVGAAVAAYKLFTASQRRAEEETQKFQAGLQRMSDEVNKGREQIGKLNEAFETLKTQDLSFELGIKEIKLANKLLKAQADQRSASHIRNLKALISNNDAQKKGLQFEKSRLKIVKQLRDNAFKRQEIARAEIVMLEKKKASTFGINKGEEKTLKLQREVSQEAANQRRNYQKIIDDYEKGTGEIKNQGALAKNLFLEQVRLKDAVNQTNEKTQESEKRQEAYRKKVDETIKLILGQDKALDSVSKTIQSMIGDSEKMNQSHASAAASLLSTEAQTLRIQSERGTQNQRAVALVKAENKEAQALLIKYKEQDRQLDIRQASTGKQIANAINLNMIALAELETLKKTTKDKKAIQAATERQAKAAANLAKIQTSGQAKLAAIENEREDNRKQRAADQEQREEKALQKRLKNEETFKKAVEKTDLAIAKGIELIEKAAEKAAEKRIEAVSQALQGVVAFVDDIVNPQALIQKASSAIGATFGALGSVVGDAVGGIIGGIAALGEKTPEEIQQEFTGFLEAFEKGLEILPELLVKLLPRFAVAIAEGVILAIPMLLKGISDELIRLGKNIIEGMRQFFQEPQKYINEKSEEEFSRMSKVFDKYFGISFENQAAIKESFGFRTGGRILSARSGMRVTSGSFGAAQLAMVHPGEIITPQSGSRPQAIDRTLNQMSGGQGVTVVINSAVTEASAIDGLVRKIENRFRTFGSATSPLFG